ncbi:MULTISPECIES: urea carboxylase [unclassified Novosphingobium]|uniref:urea carboxylase n=1 Tax=unclassified Novosphingobium TaxID=2644732 RepID=UPI001494ED15|nr:MULTISPECIES: urea carboxylase [unclassified Novosphingobium]MBB3357888.1 urea carboxylase [Novosphingobium sp. BK256]MBB3374249.1 urea carboxylase [Novosphingobium sp. BK280]MBB3378661.1 urea carboxylase [Novosphingobium sp. BK258]MBB3420355.1 urea carboxylase [Novosphingobium sp. BK267]MBB3448523.1 urea carboxylase [Novosphingobium sp. BK352]
MMFDTVLIANRGAIATRIIRTLRQLGLRSVTVYSEADEGSAHVALADEAVCIGPARASESYLNIPAIIAAAKQTGAGAIHPGYGFLAENVEFADACAAEGIVFIGPTPDNIRTFGLKHSARELAKAHGVPLAPGSDLLTSEDEAVEAAEAIGYPIMLKATAGGGGIGMRVCETEADVREGFATVARLGQSNFGDAGVFLERYVRRARHVEVQIFGDGAGRIVALGERDCSLQRRNQKVVEEAPAPLLPESVRADLYAAAIRLGEAARYRSAGTVEFLYDADRKEFFFLEMNTRLQVEHGVTEEVMGLDLVAWMVRGGAGDFTFLDSAPTTPSGHSVQVRLYAEDPALDYRPTSGTLTAVEFPADIRTETWVVAGTEVSAWYDPMLAKLIVHAPTREAAVAAMQQALAATRIDGIETNLRWLRQVVASPAFTSGEVSTRVLDTISFVPASLRVIAGGTATTVQDWPGRQHLWAVGVPPSGPMDDQSFRLGNRLLGNPEGMAGLEMTHTGPTLAFTAPARICLTGADFGATLDGVAVPLGEVIAVAAGQTLATGRTRGGGMRGYLLIGGGLDIAPYLGSRATFELGQFGGHAARRLVAGDVLHLGDEETAAPLPAVALPAMGSEWTLRVLYGPHGAPDFFTDEDIAMVVGADWQVHYNSNRTGVRLIGPKPQWARADGGEAGLHPSNIHDNPYAIGAVDFTGDMPIILGPDGPSLGGFVCPFVVIAADRWKIGQLVPGDRLRFVPVSIADAQAADAAQRALVADGTPPAPRPAREIETLSPILAEIAGHGTRPRTVYRQQGDRNILVEYGPITLDIELRIRVHALMTELERMALPGVIDVVPGIRSLQVHFDGQSLDQQAMLAALVEAEERLGDLEDFTIPSRIVHLPLSWRDPATLETIQKYMGAVRDDAPWCPDNIEFIRRVNGLPDAAAVENLIFEANYLVMGLGDVYLGAPVATPVDPRHRLVTTKYNPARTWTPPNVVGIGGAYMCIYGMEGPGGYQLFGRTIQVWNTHRQTDAFIEGKPWLLRFFDQIRFYPVSADELVEWRRDFPTGRRSIQIEPSEFRLADYRQFLADNAAEIAAFEAQRVAAFDAERADWQRRGEFDRVTDLADADAPVAGSVDVPDGADLVEAPFGGSVWKLLVAEGDEVKAGDTIAVLEAMKMECAVESPGSGVVAALYMQEKQALQPGAPMLALRRHAA